ncbi:MAG TPA: PQQ-binding-like beta-propeller repeat protein [Gaiellaceae bacterium]|nr:PQQ-binding-like beta-propeller repeat protein [Gaiellaceae bacterium]
MRRSLAALPLALVAAGCSSHANATKAASTDSPTSTDTATSTTPKHAKPRLLVSTLGLPRVHSAVVPGYVLIADRNNNRVLLVSPSKQVVWRDTSLIGPDDAFFTPGYRTIITNEEFHDTLVELSLKTHARVWQYGHGGVAGSSPGYLNTPDDAYRLPSGITTVADIQNCRVVQINRAHRVVRVLGGSCAHDPPRGLSSPNGDTPLPDGGLLVTEIGGWIDRLAPDGRLLWSIRSPVSYPSDAQLLPDGRVLVASFSIPGKIVIVDRSGRVTWSFGAASGPNRLAKPSLAVRWPNGLIAANDDYNHRVIVIDPRTKKIVWQYGHTGVAGTAPGYLNKPDGLDLLPASQLVAAKASMSAPAAKAPATASPAVQVRRVGSLPQPVSKLSAVALADGRVAALGGLVGGSSSDQVLLGTPAHLRRVATLPAPSHDAAAALVHGIVYLFGGGQAASTDAVVRFDPYRRAAVDAGTLGEPLSDLGAATVGGSTYLVGGYTGSRYATAVLRFRPGLQPTLVTRLPSGLRYAGVAALGSKLYVAGGLTVAGPSRWVYAVDPAARTVTKVATLPRPVDHVALARLGSRLLLVGGGSRQVLAIDPRAGTVRAVGSLPQPLTDPAAVPHDGHVLVLGGGTSAVYALG